MLKMTKSKKYSKKNKWYKDKWAWIGFIIFGIYSIGFCVNIALFYSCNNWGSEFE